MTVGSWLFLLLFCHWNTAFAGDCSGDKTGEDNPRGKRDNADTGISGRHYLHCNPQYTFDCCGIIEECEYYTKIAGTLQIQVWRPTGVLNEYQLVGEFSHTGVANDEAQFTLPTSSQPTVRDGDCIGWYSTGEDMVTYDNSGSESLLVYDGLGDLPEGTTLDWSPATVISNQEYAINCRTRAGSSPSFVAGLATTESVSDGENVGYILSTAVSVTDSNSYDILTMTMSNTYFRYNPNSNTDGYIDVISALSGASGTIQTLSFTVTDDCGKTDTYSLAVSVTNVAPVLSNLVSVSVSEDTATETSLHAVDCTDPLDDVSVSLTAQSPNSDPLKFTVKPDTANGNVYTVYTTYTPSFDFDAVSQYDLTLACTDTKDTVTGTLTVYIVPNQIPVITNLASPTSVRVSTNTEASVIIYTVTHSDAEGDPITYTLTCDTACPFEITNSGDVQTTQPLSAITTTSFEATILISDLKGTGTPGYLTIEISDINDIPSITNMDNIPEVYVSENSALSTSLFDVEHQDTNTLDTITYSLSPNPATDIFSIDSSTGLITTSSTRNIDYEALTDKSFVLTVSVSDGKATTTGTVAVSILDVNEALTFNQASYLITVSEGQAMGSQLPDPPLSWTDPDAGDTQSCYLDCGTSTSDFIMDANTCIVTFANVYSLDEGKPSQVLCDVTAVDSGGLTASASYTVSITDVNNYSPLFIPNVYYFFISESSPLGTNVGTVIATDQDASTFGTITYSLNQSLLSDLYYQVNASTGQITLQNSLLLCSCPSAKHSIQVIATDRGQLSSSATVHITVLDVTTPVTTAAPDRYKTFFDSPVSIAWFIAILILSVVTACTSIYILCKYVPGWPKNLCKRGKGYHVKRQRHNRNKKQYGPPSRDEVQTIDKKVMIDSVRKPPPANRFQAWRHL